MYLVSSNPNQINPNTAQFNAAPTKSLNQAPAISRDLQTDLKSAWGLAKTAYSIFGPQGQKMSGLDKLKAALSFSGQIGSFLKNQIGADSKNGVGLIDGAMEFSDNVSNALKMFQSAKDVRSLSDVGQMGQDYVLNNFKSQLMQSAAQELGVDISKFSVEKAGEMAWNYFSSGGLPQAGASGAGMAVEGASGIGEGLAGAGTAATENGTLAAGNQVLGAAGAAYAAYGLIDNWGESTPQMGAIQGATVGAYIGSVVPGVGTVIGGVVGAVVGGAMGFIHTGKSKDQKARDMVREGLQNVGMVDKDWGLKLADGSTFDIGKDGGAKLENADGTSRRYYEVDFNNPLAGQVVGWLQPLVAVLCNGDDKLANQFTGYFTNAALSNATDLESAKQNVLAMYQNSSVSGEQLAAGLQALQGQSQITQDEYAAYMNGINTLVA